MSMRRTSVCAHRLWSFLCSPNCAARISEYVCDLEYLFSGLNRGFLMDPLNPTCGLWVKSP